MKVFVLEYYDYGGSVLLGIYATSEAAKKGLEKYMIDSPRYKLDDFDISETEVKE